MEQARGQLDGAERAGLLGLAAWRLDEARGVVRDQEEAAESEWCRPARPLVRQHVEQRRRAVEDAAATLATLRDALRAPGRPGAR